MEKAKSIGEVIAKEFMTRMMQNIAPVSMKRKICWLPIDRRSSAMRIHEDLYNCQRRRILPFSIP